MSLNGDRVTLESWRDKHRMGCGGSRRQKSVLTAYMSENSSAATLSSCLRPAEEQPVKGTAQAGRAASLALPMPAAFLHEEQE